MFVLNLDLACSDILPDFVVFLLFFLARKSIFVVGFKNFWFFVMETLDWFLFFAWMIGFLSC